MCGASSPLSRRMGVFAGMSGIYLARGARDEDDDDATVQSFSSSSFVVSGSAMHKPLLTSVTSLSLSRSLGRRDQSIVLSFPSRSQGFRAQGRTVWCALLVLRLMVLFANRGRRPLIDRSSGRPGAACFFNQPRQGCQKERGVENS